MPPKPLFCEGVFSQIGRKTQESGRSAAEPVSKSQCSPRKYFTAPSQVSHFAVVGSQTRTELRVERAKQAPKTVF